MTGRDDMKMTPQIRGSISTPRERAEEERRTTVTRKRRGRLLDRLRRARRARQARGGRGRRPRKVAPTRTRIAATLAAKAARIGIRGASLASKFIPIAGQIALVAEISAEATIAAGRAARLTLGGQSERLVAAEDAATVLGDLQVQADANATVLNQIEGDDGLLRAIGQDGRVNRSIQSMINSTRKRALMRARGADLINRSPAFDSRDSLQDKILGAARDAELKGSVDEILRRVRERGLGKMSTGR